MLYMLVTCGNQSSASPYKKVFLCVEAKITRQNIFFNRQFSDVPFYIFFILRNAISSTTFYISCKSNLIFFQNLCDYLAFIYNNTSLFDQSWGPPGASTVQYMIYRKYITILLLSLPLEHCIADCDTSDSLCSFIQSLIYFSVKMFNSLSYFVND